MDATISHDPSALLSLLLLSAVRFPPLLWLLMQQPVVADPLALPRSVLGVLLEFADHRSLHQLEAACRAASALIDATGTLRDSSDPQIALQNLAEVAQIECGCETLACYWSSSPSQSQHAQDFIEYTTRANCLVSKIQVLPYRAFWHPDSPTFAPQCVSFAFYAPVATSEYDLPIGNNENKNSSNNRNALQSSDVKMLDNDDVAIEYKARVKFYESPVYTMLNDMQLHEFELPKKVWLAHGATFRLNLIGRYQQETFEMPPWIPADEQEPAEPPYYCCLSYVNAIGVSYDYR
ncbi:hypothetical protein FI667_g8449, partial [Globisporangium splendens]